MFSFKAYLLRWMAATALIAPYTADQIMPVIKTSAAAAAKSCIGGNNQRTCGISWSSGTYDGHTGVGQEMASMAAIYLNLQALEPIIPPVTNFTGGTSQGNPDAGANTNNDLSIIKYVLPSASFKLCLQPLHLSSTAVFFQDVLTLLQTGNNRRSSRCRNINRTHTCRSHRHVWLDEPINFQFLFICILIWNIGASDIYITAHGRTTYFSCRRWLPAFC